MNYLEKQWQGETLSDNRSLNHFSQCKDCIYRDKTKVWDEERGYLKGFCELLDEKQNYVYDNSEACEFYEQE